MVHGSVEYELSYFIVCGDVDTAMSYHMVGGHVEYELPHGTWFL